jgi:Ca2+/Na+ antiporter
MERPKFDRPKFEKDDINAVANSRFFRKSGQRYLMLLAIVIMGLAIVTNTLQLIPYPVYYGAIVVSAIVFVYFYAKRQREVRKELWKSIEDWKRYDEEQEALKER